MIGFAVVGPKYNVGDEAAAEYAEGGNVDPEAPTLEWYFVGWKHDRYVSVTDLLTMLPEISHIVPHDFETRSGTAISPIHVAYSTVQANDPAHVAHRSNIPRGVHDLSRPLLDLQRYHGGESHIRDMVHCRHPRDHHRHHHLIDLAKH